MKRRFDLIIFDWDGTLINSIDWIVSCLQLAAERCQLPRPPAHVARNTIGLSIDNAMQALFPSAEQQLIADLVSHYQQTYQSQLLGQEHFFPGVYDMLVSLKQAGYQLAVATGKTRRELDKVLKSTQTTELFDITRSADETASKPSPKMLEEILAFCGCASDKALMVGDSIYDLEMAINANMPVIAVSCGAHSQDVLKNYQPLHCLQYPVEIMSFI